MLCMPVGVLPKRSWAAQSDFVGILLHAHGSSCALALPAEQCMVLNTTSAVGIAQLRLAQGVPLGALQDLGRLG